MNLTNYEQKTLEVLAFSSKERPITGKRIANMIGLPYRVSGMEGADMRAIIHDLRIKGYPICAGDKGYWYAKTDKELNEFIYTLKARIRAQKEVVDGLKRAFDKVKIKTEEEKLKELSKLCL
jgi:hypothetical protein